MEFVAEYPQIVAAAKIVVAALAVLAVGAVLTEPYHPGEFILSLANGTRSKANLTAASGQDLDVGEVCARVIGATAAAHGGGAEGANTGTGAVGSITISHEVEIGVYDLNCTSTGPGVAAAGSSAAQSAPAANTGNATITASPATGAGCQPGVYRIVCRGAETDLGDWDVFAPDGTLVGVAKTGVEFTTHITFTITDGSTDSAAGDAFLVTVAAANSGTFTVKTPSGIFLPDATVGVAYTGLHLGFTISDATDFIVGDGFTITTAEGQVKVLAPAATDGTQIASCLPIYAVDASGGAVEAAFVVRDAELNTNKLTWPSAISAANQAIAVAHLADRGILIL